MADLFSTIKTIYGLAKKIKEVVGKIRDNREDCSRLLELVGSVSAIVQWQQQQLSLHILRDDNHLMSSALMGLKTALERGCRDIEGCQGQQENVLKRIAMADSIASTLHRVWEDISRNMLMALYATVACNLLLTARMNAHDKDMLSNAVRAKDASISSRLPSLSKQIKEALPESVHLPPEVEKSVETYCSSIRSASSYHQNNKDKRMANKAQVASSLVALSAGPSYTPSLRRRTMEHGETSSIREYCSSEKVSISKNNQLAGRSPSLASSLIHASKSTSMRSTVVRQGGPISIVNKIIRRLETKTGATLIPIDVHPKKTWVVMTSEEVGGCVIWDYQKKVMELQVKMKQRVCSAKFIVQKEWLAVGTGDGSIYIYSYTGTDVLREVNSFKAYAGCCEEETKAYTDKAIYSLAVHPRELRLLLAFGCTIMQWQYLRDDHTWKRIRKIEMRSPVRSLKYNPRGGGDTFVIVTCDNEAKIYTTDFSSDPAITLEATSSADYYPTNNNQHWVVTCQNASSISEIRDFKTRKVAHTLEVSGLQMVQVACHPTHHILATSTIPKDKDKRNTKDRGTESTTSEDRIIYLWDANTYRIEKMVQIPGMGSRHSMEFATDDRNGLTRLFVKFETKIAIVEVNLLVTNTSQRTRHEYGRAI